LRLSAVSLREDDVVRPDGFDLASFWSQWLEEFEASRRSRNSGGALALRDRAALRVGAVAVDSGGEWLVITVPLEQLEHAHRDLLGLGNGIEVLGPPKLRAKIGASARAIARLYASGAAAS
jgi:predicted DNA-binding transcriptional regulator YafY